MSNASDSNVLRDAKISLIVLVGVLTFAASVVPWCLKRVFKRAPLDALNVCTAFAAGIVFAALLLHMIPEGSEHFSNYMKTAYALPPEAEAPHVPELFNISCYQSHCGDLTFELEDDKVHVEGFNMTCYEHDCEPDGHDHRLLWDAESPHFRRLGPDAHGAGEEAHDAHSNPNIKLIEFPWCTLTIGLTALFLVTIDRTIVAHGVHTDGAGHSHDGHDHDHVSASFVAMQKQAAAEEAGNKSSYGMVARSVVSEPSDGAAAGGDKPLEKTAIEVHQCGADEVAVTAKAARREAAMKAWVFFVALSLHSIMDGLSLGSERDINSFYAILVAVLAHKAFDGIALGVPVYLAQMPPLQTWGTLLFCAFMTPLGVGIGWAAAEGSKGPQGTLASAVIVSISAGSFLYISIMELLPASLHDGRYLPLKLFVFLVGFVAMAIIRAYIH